MKSFFCSQRLLKWFQMCIFPSVIHLYPPNLGRSCAHSVCPAYVTLTLSLCLSPLRVEQTMTEKRLVAQSHKHKQRASIVEVDSERGHMDFSPETAWDGETTASVVNDLFHSQNMESFRLLNKYLLSLSAIPLT